ncbi:hypothetical protein SAMN05216343_10890 [Oscillibacter sp. PC13]|uniref:hypothetical protein n=1 Tax=Oscillibacter sp. PC13 TaxID=1855299 RepID=UPI0008E72103|nr:hypothetical protein [Oscillibacter sp. PC13]SFP50206.1 hypothetical protein SAMN05216343_10890 [Oscillibacter sp. PC13]
MKKQLIACTLLVSLLLVGCGTDGTSGTGDSGKETSQETGSVSADRNPTASELGREETTTLAISVEGTDEEVPATLAVRQGYSIYIPDEGWTFESDGRDDGAVWEDSWDSTVNDDVELGVRCYAEQTLDQAKQRFVQDKEDYVFEDLLGGELGDPLTGADAEDNEVLSFMAAERDGETYVVFWNYPAEAAEGFGARLSAIAQTFVLME